MRVEAASPVTPRVLTKTRFTMPPREFRSVTGRAGCDRGNSKGTDKNKLQPCVSAGMRRRRAK
jgi:hypothetical protein